MRVCVDAFARCYVECINLDIVIWFNFNTFIPIPLQRIPRISIMWVSFTCVYISRCGAVHMELKKSLKYRWKTSSQAWLTQSEIIKIYLFFWWHRAALLSCLFSFTLSLVARHQKTDTETLTFMASFDSVERVDDDDENDGFSDLSRINFEPISQSDCAHWPRSSPLHAQLQHFWSGHKF